MQCRIRNVRRGDTTYPPIKPMANKLPTNPANPPPTATMLAQKNIISQTIRIKSVSMSISPGALPNTDPQDQVGILVHLHHHPSRRCTSEHR